MKSNVEQEKSTWTKIAQSSWVQGPLLGSTVMMLVTPLLKWTNLTFNGEKMSFRNPMSGALTYAGSAIPGYATAFAFKELLSKSFEDTSERYDLLTSCAAGSLSGFVSTPFDAIALNKHISNNPSCKDTVLKMIKHNGYGSFFQGAASIMVLEGLWSTVYMTAIPIMSKSLQERGVAKQQAEFLAVLTVAGAYGLLSTPIDQMRFKKQQGLTEPTVNKSYLKHAKDIFNQDTRGSSTNPMRMLFKAATPRTVTTTVAAGLMFKGTELYNQAVNHFNQEYTQSTQAPLPK